MPLYFAYGSNMDLAAMRLRCPKARPLGRARLPRHRFGLMGKTGYATMQPEPSSTVHGLLFELALSDVAPLDRYEGVAHGLYGKVWQPVLPAGGGACQAMIYVGTDVTVGGTPPPGYMEGIVAAARAAALPSDYVASLETMLPRTAVTPACRGAGAGGAGADATGAAE